MTKKVLLVPIVDIINNSVIEQNVDQKIVGQTLSMVQDVYLKPIITSTIYNSLIDAVYDHKVNGSILPTTYADLQEAVKPYLISRTVCEFLIMNNYKISSKGVIKLSDNSGQTADENSVENLKNYYENLSSRYKQMLLDYLDENGLLEDTADTDTISESVGWFLGDDSCSTNVSNTSTQAITDTFTNSGSYDPLTGLVTFNRTDGGTYQVDLSTIITVDTVVTGGTYSNGVTTFTNNTGGTFNVSGFYTGYTPSQDVFITGGTYSSGTATFRNSTGGTFSVSGFSTGSSSLYSGNGSLVSNRIVNLSGYTLAFSSSTQANALKIGTTGNIMVGQTTDAGYQLDVAGKGRYTTSLEINTAASTAAYFPLIVTSNSSSGYGIQLKHPSTYNTYMGFTPTGWIFANSSLTISSVNCTATAFDIIVPPASTFTLRVGNTSDYIAFTATSGITTFNPSLANRDFVIRGDANASLFYVDASQDNIGIGTSSPNASAIFEVSSTSKGLLPPRMTTAQRDAISSPVAGLMIYNTTTNKHQGYNGSTWNDFY